MDYLKRNYQKVSTNRFVVDSDRFWREQWHPRFRQIFPQETAFVATFLDANQHLSFPFDIPFITKAATYLWTWLADYRFSCIPTKEPNSPGQFIADLYFTLLDILPSLEYKEFPLDEDDFNVVTNRAETGKVDTARVATDERNKSGTSHQTQNDLLTANVLSDVSSQRVENIDDRTDQNTKTVSDVFLSPQDAGVKPTINNAALSGVDGITLAPGDTYTTNTNNVNLGDTIKGKTNTTGADKTAENSLTQNSDIRTLQNATNDLESGQSQGNEAVKSDNYVETLNYDRSGKLQELYDLSLDRNWIELLNRLTKWILQAKIATAEYNYNDCEYYE